MWAKTLCPLSSSTRKKAFGSDSTILPSISMAPSFLGISSALRSWPAQCPADCRALTGCDCSSCLPLSSACLTWRPARNGHMHATGRGQPTRGCLTPPAKPTGEAHEPEQSLRDVCPHCEPQRRASHSRQLGCPPPGRPQGRQPGTGLATPHAGRWCRPHEPCPASRCRCRRGWPPASHLTSSARLYGPATHRNHKLVG